MHLFHVCIEASLEREAVELAIASRFFSFPYLFLVKNAASDFMNAYDLITVCADRNCGLIQNW